MLQHIRHDGNNVTQLCQLKAQWLSAPLRGLEVHAHLAMLGSYTHAPLSDSSSAGCLAGGGRADLHRCCYWWWWSTGKRVRER